MFYIVMFPFYRRREEIFPIDVGVVVQLGLGTRREQRILACARIPPWGAFPFAELALGKRQMLSTQHRAVAKHPQLDAPQIAGSNPADPTIFACVCGGEYRALKIVSYCYGKLY